MTDIITVTVSMPFAIAFLVALCAAVVLQFVGAFRAMSGDQRALLIWIEGIAYAGICKLLAAWEGAA